MAHSRTAIRKAFVALLTGLTTTGTNVTNWGLYAAEKEDTPKLSISVCGDEESVSDNVDNENGNTEARDLPVKVEAWATQSSSSSRVAILDTADDICAEVETALIADVTLGGLVIDMRLETTSITLDGSGELPVVKVEMAWIVVYSVDRSAP